MTTIYKYSLDICGVQIIEMPAGARPLCIQVQNGAVQLWAMVDSDKELEHRSIVMLGTGWRVEQPEELDYIDTVQLGNFVWHFFMEKI